MNVDNREREKRKYARTEKEMEVKGTTVEMIQKRLEVERQFGMFDYSLYFHHQTFQVSTSEIQRKYSEMGRIPGPVCSLHSHKSQLSAC